MKTISKNKQLYPWYTNAEDYVILKSREEGKTYTFKTLKAIALKLLKQGMSAQQVSLITELPLDEIGVLK